jgi:hypothetical protein
MLAVLSLGIVALTLNWFDVATAFLLIGAEFKVGLGSLSLLISLYIVGYGLTHIPGGLLATKIELCLRTAEPINGAIRLAQAQVGTLDDDPAVRPPEIWLNGFVYDTIRHLTGRVPVAERIDWVSRGPYGYQPQPYEQLATYYRRAGHDDDVRRPCSDQARSCTDRPSPGAPRKVLAKGHLLGGPVIGFLGGEDGRATRRRPALWRRLRKTISVEIGGGYGGSSTKDGATPSSPAAASWQLLVVAIGQISMTGRTARLPRWLCAGPEVAGAGRSLDGYQNGSQARPSERFRLRKKPLDSTARENSLTCAYVTGRFRD